MKLIKYKKLLGKQGRRAYVSLKRAYKLIAYKNKHARLARKYARMEARKAIKLGYKAIQEQVAIRPRMRLFSKVTLILVMAFVLSSQAVSYLKPREAEIKINGQAIFIARAVDEKNETETEITQSVSTKRSPFDFKYPVDGYVSQGYFGYHRAFDIATDLGTSISPLGKGRVEFAGVMPDGRGRVVVIDHGDGLKSLYAHMGRIDVGVGNEVDSGVSIGTVGLTGRTTGPHVHLEVYDSGVSINPGSVLPDKN